MCEKSRCDVVMRCAGFWRSLFCDCCRSCRLPGSAAGGKRAGPYQSVHEMTASSSGQTGQSSSAGVRRPLTLLDLDDHVTAGGAGGGGGVEPHVDMERADASIELARVKSADADVRQAADAGSRQVRRR